MTENFEFKEPQVTLKLCGQEFLVTAGEKTAEICGDILAEAKHMLSRLKSGDCDRSLSEAGICNFLKEGIERLLGKGSVDSIFGTRTQEVSDMAELMCYIVSRVKAAYLGKA